MISRSAASSRCASPQSSVTVWPRKAPEIVAQRRRLIDRCRSGRFLDQRSYTPSRSADDRCPDLELNPFSSPAGTELVQYCCRRDNSLPERFSRVFRTSSPSPLARPWPLLACRATASEPAPLSRPLLGGGWRRSRCGRRRGARQSARDRPRATRRTCPYGCDERVRLAAFAASFCGQHRDRPRHQALARLERVAAVHVLEIHRHDAEPAHHDQLLRAER